MRSYGTEDRQAAKQIPPRNEVYEFIIFRGSDIKDLNVSEMPEEPAATSSPPQDPAILSAVIIYICVWWALFRVTPPLSLSNPRLLPLLVSCHLHPLFPHTPIIMEEAQQLSTPIISLLPPTTHTHTHTTKAWPILGETTRLSECLTLDHQ